MEAAELIQLLDLAPLPEEGGYYREVFRSEGQIPELQRNFSTHIYYLVTPEEFSALHRVRSDELFHFYLGDPVQMATISPEGRLQELQLGHDITAGLLSMTVVPRGYWQGIKLKPGGKWALMGCTVAPGFEFEDFESGVRQDLVSQFPQHQKAIEAFTRPE